MVPAACVATSILLSDRRLRIYDKSEMVNTRYDTLTLWISCNINTNKICSDSQNLMMTRQDLVKTKAFGNLKTVGLFRSSKKIQVVPSLYKCRQLEPTQSEYRRAFIWMPGIRFFLIINCVWSGVFFVIIILTHVIKIEHQNLLVFIFSESYFYHIAHKCFATV